MAVIHAEMMGACERLLQLSFAMRETTGMVSVLGWRRDECSYIRHQQSFDRLRAMFEAQAPLLEQSIESTHGLVNELTLYAEKFTCMDPATHKESPDQRMSRLKAPFAKIRTRTDERSAELHRLKWQHRECPTLTTRTYRDRDEQLTAELLSSYEEMFNLVGRLVEESRQARLRVSKLFGRPL